MIYHFPLRSCNIYTIACVSCNEYQFIIIICYQKLQLYMSFSQPLLALSMSHIYSSNIIFCQSLNSKETSVTMNDQDPHVDSLNSQNGGLKVTNSQLQLSLMNLTEKLKSYLCTDDIPMLNKSEHFQIQRANNFIGFTNCLLKGLRCALLFIQFYPCFLVFTFSIKLAIHFARSIRFSTFWKSFIMSFII